ncbi:facilitated trehalose transporter Tret1-like [Anthonomus grandis grandis]|uniref:facilitated trehalose transporter Tret1-like n=1 Tax=Anthonomus grandis grandis TaxID=2921223 RepID=UPI002166A136|nr:facilitated trehalose transporter Tret1-like [Anthonomus grandis grandis]
MAAEAKKLPQYFAAVSICIGAMGTGTVIGWTSNISDELTDGSLNNIKLDLSWAGAIMCLGAMCTCIPIGILADKIGRKLCVLFTIIPFIIGWVLIILTKHVAMFLVGRFLTGFAGGSFCIVGPLYTSETSQKEIRGTLGTFMQLFITIGILFSNGLGWALDVLYFSIMCAIVPAVFGILFVFQPESPIYLLKKGKKDRALKAYQRLRGSEYDPSEEVGEIEKHVAKEEELKGQFWTTLKTKPGWKSSIICFSLMFYQQLSGINAVMFYSGAIFKDAASSVQSELCVTIVGAVQVVATVFSSWSVEKLGRKVLLMVSAGVMALSTLLMGIYFLLKDKELVDEETIKSIGWLPLLALTLFIIAFSFGYGPIPWLASAEIFPPAIMAMMSSLAGMFNWFCAFIVAVGYEPLSKAVGSYVTFFIFTIISATAVFFVLIVMPETKGKTFQEIQEELAK